ncbi:hypothetical protein DE4585_00606 [Mycobacteroides salmoniphilum]|uniref:DUF3558 domain-containing protein n=1 Tax=Mycobacteroides salmoniphilum TaxID=404941 RepID=A0A4R8S7S4_9MYCO|nr:hypothetical protein [Mycobacteroides salmoniphilum]TDZ86353.1 hypothetical protein DE4585_00606 [Mycobacteroides salmoniphilum]
MSVRRWSAVLAGLMLVAGCSPRPEDWRSHTDTDSAQLAVEAALRDIDPCGFVDADLLNAKIPDAISYGYTDGFDRCTLRLGAYDGDFVSDVSATIGFDLAPEQLSEPPVDSMEVNGIAVSHVLGPTSNRGWCRYVFNLDESDAPGVASQDGAADLMKRVRVVVVASLARDPGPGRPVYPCKEAIAIATGAAQIRSRHLPLRSDHGPAGQDPCSVFPDLRGFTSYRPGGIGIGAGLYSCAFSSGPPADPKTRRTLLALRPVDARQHGDEFGSEAQHGVALEIRGSDCEVVVRGDTQVVPIYFDPKPGDAADVRLAGVEVTGASCEENKAVAVAAGKRFGQP